MRIFFIITIIIATHNTYSQTNWIAWSHHASDTEVVNGLSFGVGSYISKYSDVNGIKFDIPGLGVFLPMGLGEDPYNPGHVQSDSLILSRYLDKKSSIKLYELPSTNGLYLSLTGDREELVNGISINPIGGLVEVSNGLNINGIMGFNTISNGLTISLFILSTGTLNGVSISLYSNSTVELNGVQIGLFNTSFKTSGLQIGLWNKNEMRTLPIVNWN